MAYFEINSLLVKHKSYEGIKTVLDIDHLEIQKGETYGIVGESGQGKTVLALTILQLLQTPPGFIEKGEIMLDGEDVNQPRTNVVRLRQKVGMVFQKPNPFPKSIFENVAYGLRVNGVKDENLITEKVELALRRAALWTEVEDRLSSSALGLSGGQQQRLCIARALAVEPQRPGPHRHPQGGREHRGAQGRPDHHHRDPQHAAGGPHLRPDGLLLHGPSGGKRQHGRHLHPSVPKRDGRLHHRQVRLMVLQDYTPQHMLATLRTRLLVMYAQVDIALEEAARSYEKGEAVRAIAVCDGDTAIDALENEIDELCLRLMARIKPVAGDLRFVVAALRMVVDLERIGDEAVTVAEQTVLMEDVPGRRILADEVCGMMQRAREAFMRAMDCFREGNGEEALALRNCEDEALQNEMRIVQRLLELLRQEEGKRPDPQLVMHTLLVVRALTRIWRRSVNLAEQVYFMQHGQSLKHSGEKK